MNRFHHGQAETRLHGKNAFGRFLAVELQNVGREMFDNAFQERVIGIDAQRHF